MEKPSTLEIDRPFDMHVHLRSGAMMAAVLPHTARQFAGAVVMPNRPWIVSPAEMLLYKATIRSALPMGLEFSPLMTIALDDTPGKETKPQTILDARTNGAVAAKLYPVHRGGPVALAATTGPADGQVRGVADPTSAPMRAVYRAMAECGMVLCVHAEVPYGAREAREGHYIPTLDKIRRFSPGLKMVIEHVSDWRTVNWVDMQEGDLVGATITAHHLLDTLDDALQSPHSLCNPVPKGPRDLESLWDAIEEGHPRFFFGSDSAPHPDYVKHCARPGMLHGAGPCPAAGHHVRGTGAPGPPGTLHLPLRPRLLRHPKVYVQSPPRPPTFPSPGGCHLRRPDPPESAPDRGVAGRGGTALVDRLNGLGRAWLRDATMRAQVTAPA